MIGTTLGCGSQEQHWSLLKMSPQKQTGYVDCLNEYLPGVRSYFPEYTRLARPHGARRAKEVTRPVYPGYVFIMVSGVDMHAPVTLPVSARWVKFGGVVETVPNRVIEVLRDMAGRNELVREIKHVNPYVPGARVYVHTSVQDIMGVIIRLVGKNRAVVDTSLCRATVPVHRLRVLG